MIKECTLREQGDTMHFVIMNNYIIRCDNMNKFVEIRLDFRT